MNLPSEWHPAWPVLAAAGLALGLFAQAFVRLRGRGRSDHAGWDRAALFTFAVAAGVIVLVSPLDELGDEYLLSAHMLQHVVLGDVAPALAIVALRGPLIFFLVPPAVLRPLARTRWLRASLGFLIRPSVSFVLWALAIGAWHLPPAYDYALDNEWAHQLEHVSFVLTGTLIWTQLIDPARRRALEPAGRMLYMAGLFFAGHALTHPILFDSEAHYAPYVAQPERLFGLSAVADQHWAGIVMTVEQLLTFGTLTALLLLRRLPACSEIVRRTSTAPSSSSASRKPSAGISESERRKSRSGPTAPALHRGGTSGGSPRSRAG